MVKLLTGLGLSKSAQVGEVQSVERSPELVRSPVQHGVMAWALLSSDIKERCPSRHGLCHGTLDSHKCLQTVWRWRWKLERTVGLEEAWSHGQEAAEVEGPVSGDRAGGLHGTNMTASPVTSGARPSRTQKRTHKPEALSYFVMSFPLNKKGRRIGQGDAL